MPEDTDAPGHMPRTAWLLPVGTLACAGFGAPAALALALGIGAAFAGANTAPERWHHRAHWLLQLSVIALGAGIELPAVARAGLDGLGVTLVSISAILVIGNLVGRALGVPRHTRLLISAGTAICGGSAIAAVAGVLKPRQHETAAALGIVFILNAVALVLFPFIGRLLHMSEPAFGWWAALAIHDTSSVVGAGLAYGPQALTLATTIKLARALWIVPVAFFIAHLENRQNRADNREPASGTAAGSKFPWFILGFIALAALRWTLPGFAPAGDWIALAGRHCLSASLFLIGAGLSPLALRKVGWSPALLGLGIWIPTAAIALLFAVLWK
ncbi:putative sulfate exporter family transporter [Ruficoccus amylovorans]|uniref:Putative sulfate exporter family transporter n=1 Tax=Ruficoccus amylovorans TaxID=1804625 RepID=A0A842HJH5_9BACT|nr:putative sulfate exporter family transporter [Ruficoccus amylovorans]MBC2595784.1 putative sulfate exporter family transporter [Ruficoccus amylovorans]